MKALPRSFGDVAESSQRQAGKNEKVSSIEEDITEIGRFLYDVVELQESQDQLARERNEEKGKSAVEMVKKGEALRELDMKGMKYGERKRQREDTELINLLKAKEAASNATQGKKYEMKKKRI